MKKITLLTWISAVFLTFVVGTSGCTGAKQAGASNSAVSGSLAAKEKALLWKISGKKLKQPSYLFGTIHMISEEDFFMPKYVEAAFAKSKKVVFEINTDKMNDMSMMSSLMDMMFMEDGTTLKDLLSEDDYKRVKEKLGNNPLMMMMGDMVDKIKPLFLSSMLEQGDLGGGGGNPFGGGGMDMGSMKSYEMEFTQMAKKQEKPIDGLETIAFQMSMFDSISLEDQAKMLVQALDAGDEADGEAENVLDEMVKLYTQQDIPGLHAMIREQSEGSSEFEDKFLTLRNKNWIPLMAEAMTQQITFFAVGAGHLGGEEGVVGLLRKEGYVVTPVLK